MMEDVDKVFALFGLKFVNSIAAAFVSFASLRFWDNLTTFDKWSTALGGWALAVWGAPPLRAYFQLAEGVEIGLVLLIAFFGIAAGGEGIKLLRTADWKGLTLAVIDAVFRRAPPAPPPVPPPAAPPKPPGGG